MKTKNNKSIKKLMRERESGRQVKARELETEFDARERRYQEFRSQPVGDFDDAISVIAARLLDKKLHQIKTCEDYVRRGLEEWDSKEPVVVSGRYKDEKKLRAEYQQKFVDLFRQCHPDVVAELRELVPTFDRVFGDNKAGYEVVFDWDRVADLVDPDHSLDTLLSLPLMSLFEQYNLSPFTLEFRPNKYHNFRYDFKWVEYRLLLQFLYLLIPQSDEMVTTSKVETSDRSGATELGVFSSD